MTSLTETQITALIAALGCVLALIAFLVHDRRMRAYAAAGKPWVKPLHPLLLLTLATALSILTAVLALQRR
ncbi:MAG: hypothetical protein ACUVX8_14380 [Candidatus Zipacnadales bacterium]